MSERYEFTSLQEDAIGKRMVDNWGDNFQTGFDEHNTPYLASQTGPNYEIKYYYFYPDGTEVVG